MKCTICNTEITRDNEFSEVFNEEEKKRLSEIKKDLKVCSDCGKIFLLCTLKGERDDIDIAHR